MRQPLSSKLTFASGLSATQSSNGLLTPRTVRGAAPVELLDDRSEGPATLDRVGDDRGGGRQVGDDAALEVEDEVRFGGQVEQPVRVASVRGCR